MKARRFTYILFPFLFALPSCTGLEEQEDPEIYSVSSLEAEDVDVTEESLRFTFGAKLQAGAKVTGEKSFVFSRKSDFSVFSNVPADDDFTAEAMLKNYGETVYLKAVFSNGKNRVESEPVSFTILPFEDYVTFVAPEIKSLSDNSASFTAGVQFAEGVEPDKFSFELSESNSPFKAIATIGSTLSAGSISAEFKSLTPGGTYYVRAFVSEDNNTAFSSVVEFKTEAVLPSLAIPSISEVLYDSALASGEVLSDGGDEISEQGFVFSLSQNPTLDNATKVISNDKGVGKYSLTLQNLAPGRLYYIKSFATNSKGTAYSLETSFKTGVTIPALTTTSISSITSSSAKSGGKISADGGAGITARGVVWAETPSPELTSNKTSDGTGLGEYVSSISGLKPGTKYYVRAYASNATGTAYGNELTFTTEIALPSVTTSNITDITSDSAKGGGSITSDGGSEITAKGIVWSTSQNPTVSLATKTSDGTGASAFTSQITGLTPGKTYYVRAYATNKKGTAYGTQVSFKAGTLPPSVTTSSVSSITSSSATCGGNVTNDGGASVTARGVVWSTNQNPTISLSTKTSNGTGTGSFTSSISGLEPGKTYYVRAYATNVSGTTYGEEKAFTTAIALPVVVTSSITDITSSSAKGGGSITSDGGSQITAKGIVWSTSQNPTISLSTKTNDGTGTSSFISSITGLTPGTTYYVRAYATNAKGTSYGAQVSFSAGKAAPSVSTAAVSNIDSRSATCGGEVTFNGGSAVTSRGVVWSLSHNPTVSLSTKTVDGSGDGSFVSSISGLEPGKTYYVRAYATNLYGTSYGEERTFTTDIEVPVVATTSISEITSSSAKGGGSISFDGGSQITAKGVVWSTSQNPTISLLTKTDAGTGTSSFVSLISGLTPGVTYYVRAYATNAKGTAYGEQVSFKTGTVAPTITTSTVVNITSSSATCGGNITFDGGAPVTARGVVWSQTHNPTVSLSSKTSDGTGSGSFNSSISGLEPGKTYYVRAYATNASGTAYGNEQTFTTQIALPVVVTSPITDIASDSAKGGGSITFDGGSAITAKGVVWSTSQNPTISLSTKTNDGTGTAEYTSLISGLTPGSTYYVRAYATNAVGTAYGNEESFKTDIAVPVVKTADVTEITSESAVCGGSIISDGGSEITAKGVVWSTSHNPVVSLPTKTNDGTGTSSYTSTISHLDVGVVYYVRAYATNAKGTAYGEEVVFTTDSPNDQYVNLGLSVKWATCNIGATAPEQYGGYYQWAGLEDVTDTGIYLYSDHCPYHTGQDKVTGWTKYVPAGYPMSWAGDDEPDNKTRLDPEDDIAFMTLGDKWRMPTFEEWKELSNQNNCSWTWTSINGIKGYKVQSLMPGFTGRWIFLPAAGERQLDYIYAQGVGIYWSSELRHVAYAASIFYFTSESATVYYTHDRYKGHSVRPVYDD